MKTLIITGGNVSYKTLEMVYDETIDYVVAVDGGLAVIDEYNNANSSNKATNISNNTEMCRETDEANKTIKLDYVIGDFDTVDTELLNRYKEKGVKIGQYPAEKDYTDTHLALEEAMKMGADDIIIIGATGTRLDHTLANISLLCIGLDKKIPCKIVNDHNEIYMIDEQIQLCKQEGCFISIIPVSERITGISLEGFKYPLIDATIQQGETVGISNEIIETIGTITIEEGRALIIQARD